MRPLHPSALALLLGTMGTIATAGCAAEAPAEDDAAPSSAEAYTASLMPQEVNRRVASCFARSWASDRFATRSDPTYVESGFAASTVTKAIAATLNGFGYLLMIGSDGERVLSQLERDVKQISEEQGLAPHQRAAVVTCVTSQLITYADNGFSKALGTAAAASTYEGVCTEFARVAVRLFKAADLDAGLVAGRGHVWNWVSIEGKRYWMEPQTNPLRTVGGLFLDPRGQDASGGQFQTCTANGDSSTSDALCCSGSRSQKGTCAPTACERGGDGICTQTSAECAGIGGRSSSTSCGASVDGSVCCALPFAR